MSAPSSLIGSSGSSAVQDWIGFEEEGVVRVCTGKVELGQGIVTALAQVAASVLAVEIGRVRMISGDTERTPNEGYTGSSLSVEVSGLSVLRAALTARELLLGKAAELMDIDVAALCVDDGSISSDQSNASWDLWQLARLTDLSVLVDDRFNWDSCQMPGALIGQSVPRIDLREKIGGAAFIQDIEMPEMLHARVLKPPSFTARLASLDEAALRARFPDVMPWIDGSFVGFVAGREYDAVQALEFARPLAHWTDDAELPAIDNWPEYLRRQSCETTASERGEPTTAPANRRVKATYSKPLIAHASIAPSCALAQWQDGKLTVWSSSQGVFNLRNAIATALGLAAEDVTVTHSPSAGCYGHNGADDAAMEAALLARAFSPRPVRVQWTRADELVWSPFGSPMAVELTAELDADGRVSSWSSEIWSGTQVRRPGFLPGLVDFVATSQLARPIPFSDPRSNRLAFVSADRNADPLYDFPYVRIQQHHLPELPFRLSSLRALGGFANIFAMESFMDELAETIACDPVHFGCATSPTPGHAR